MPEKSKTAAASTVGGLGLGLMAWVFDQLNVPLPPWALITITGVAAFLIGVSIVLWAQVVWEYFCAWYWPAPVLVTPQPRPLPSASEIAAEVAAHGRISQAFALDRSKPIVGMYVIFRLTRALTSSEVTALAGVFQIADGVSEDRDSLFFAARPGTHIWTEIPGNKQVPVNGIRSTVWSFPRNSTRETRPSVIDDLLIHQFDSLNRLEVGAIMKTPFEKIDDLDHARILLRATRGLADCIEAVTLVVNDYAVFTLTSADITAWLPGHPLPAVRITRGQINPASGEYVEEGAEVVTGFSPNFMLTEDLRNTPFLTALMSPRVAADMPPMNNAATLKLGSGDVRSLKVMGGIMHRAGSRILAIAHGQHGWLSQHE